MEEEEPAETRQPQLEGEAPELQKRQRSVSPVLAFSHDERQVHQAQAESLEPLGRNAAVLDLLKAMRQEMEEGDNQLKLYI